MDIRNGEFKDFSEEEENTYAFRVKDDFFPQEFEGTIKAKSIEEAEKMVREDYAYELDTEMDVLKVSLSLVDDFSANLENLFLERNDIVMDIESRKKRLEDSKKAFESFLESKDRGKKLEDFLNKDEQNWIIGMVSPIFEEDDKINPPSKEASAIKIRNFFKKVFSRDNWKKILNHFSKEKEETNSLDELEDSKESIDRIKDYYQGLKEGKTVEPVKPEDVRALEKMVERNQAPLVEAEIISETLETPSLENFTGTTEQENTVESTPETVRFDWPKLKNDFKQFQLDAAQKEEKSLDHYFNMNEIEWLIQQAEAALEKEEKQLQLQEKGSKTNKEYQYEMLKNPVGIHCQPKGFIDVQDDKGAYGVVTYERKLTKKELKEFGMKPVEEQTLAGKVVTKTKEVLQEVLER